MKLAAVDIGTNSVRLLVSEVDADGLIRTLDRRMHITRLGQGVDASRRLAPEAIERTLTVLRQYRGVITDLGVEHVRATATSAARDATNREAFFGPGGGLGAVHHGTGERDDEAGDDQAAGQHQQPLAQAARRQGAKISRPEQSQIAE